MGKQVNFFLHPDDLPIVERAIRSTGPVVFLPDVVEEPMIRQLRNIDLPASRMGKEGLRVYVSRPEFLDEIQFRHIPQQQYFIVEPGSPVIELDRCYFDGNLIRRGRAYFYTGPDFDPDFMRWGDKVLRALRRVLVRRPDLRGYYYGPAALAWMESVSALAYDYEVVAGLEPNLA